MMICLFSIAPVTVNAEQTAVTYAVYSWDDQTKTLSHTDKTVADYIEVTEAYLKEHKYTLEGGTSEEARKVFVVKESMTLLERLKIKKQTFADLVIPEGVTLTPRQGISCSFGKNGSFAALRILGAGRIEASGKNECAAIGGDSGEVNGPLEFHGPEVTANGCNGGAGIGGGKSKMDADETTYIKIFAGSIIAGGQDGGAGIGGGNNQIGAKTYIYGGEVHGRGSDGGTGIGGGKDEGTRGIRIYGGDIIVDGSDGGAGIGAGQDSGNLGAGIWINGGTVTAGGGSYGGAGIGTGSGANMNGTIYIGGENTVVHVEGGQRGAGIGAGNGDTGFLGTEGDMKGTITIDCGANSSIVVSGGYKMVSDWMDPEYPGYDGAAAIGAGYAGNMTGKVYIKGGNIALHSGYGAAGIGGGQETDFTYQGGEGGKVYVSGGKMTIDVNNNRGDSDKGNEAIGAGSNDRKSGSVYISHDNNESLSGESYMRVCCYEKGNLVVVNANKRTSKLHSNNDVVVEPCDHTDGHGGNGLTYTLNNNGTHNEKCKYCDYNKTVAHTGSDCVCGYSNPNKTVTLKSVAGFAQAIVAEGNSFTLPYSAGDIVTGNKNPTDYHQVTGWKLRNDTSGTVYEPGSDVTVTSDMTFDLVTESVLAIETTETQNGKIVFESEYAKVDDMVKFSVEPDFGYEISRVSYKYITGFEFDDNDNYVPVYSEPDEIDVVVGENQLIMPFYLPSTANGIIVSAEFTKEPSHVYISNGIENGTVSSDMETADENDLVTLTIAPDEGYALKTLRCKKQDGTEIELTRDDDTHYTFAMPDESVFVSAEFDFSDSADGILVGHTLSLKGNIGVNFYMDLDETVANSDTAYMYFTIPGDTLTYQTVYVKEQPDASLPHAEKQTVGDKTYYVFPCSVAAKEMGSAITAQIIDGDIQGKKYAYSVKHYAEYLFAHADAEGTDEQKAYAKALPLVQEMLQYGSYARAYFDDQELSDILNVEIPETFASITSNLPDNDTFEGATLSLKSETTLSLYFTKSISFPISPALIKTKKREPLKPQQPAAIRSSESEISRQWNCRITSPYPLRSTAQRILSPTAR